MKETVHNRLCFRSVTSCCQEHSLEKAHDGLELIGVKLLLQQCFMYQITHVRAAVIRETGVHQLTYLRKSEIDHQLYVYL